MLGNNLYRLAGGLASVAGARAYARLRLTCLTKLKVTANGAAPAPFCFSQPWHFQRRAVDEGPRVSRTRSAIMSEQEVHSSNDHWPMDGS